MTEEIEIVLGVDTPPAKHRRSALRSMIRGEHVLVEGDGHIGLIAWGKPSGLPLGSVGEGLEATRYDVLAARALEPIASLGALVLSEQRALRSGARDEEYETFMREAWIPGVTALAGYHAAELLRGVAGSRAGKYAYLGGFTSEAARDALLVALGSSVPDHLRGYRRLIDESFARFLDPSLHRFLRLAITPT